MKAELVGKSSGGFSTLEIMMAFAIMMIVLTGVVTANFGAQYWTLTSQTSNEALYKAKTQLESLSATAKQNFYQATSSPLMADPDATCLSGGLCYFIQNSVTDISSCSKYAQSFVSWQVSGYLTSTTSLFSYLTNPTEALLLGGDCILNYPSGPWTNPVAYTGNLGSGNYTGIDALGGVSYIIKDQDPYLAIASSSGAMINFANNFHGSVLFNAIDVARDEATGRIYGYMAAASPTMQLQVIDLTDMNNPTTVASTSLSGVDPAGSNPQGWRIFYYGQKVYIVTRYTAGPEFHIFDVSNPASPLEIGSGFKLNTSVYGMAVRDQYSGGTIHRFVYLATTYSSKEVRVLDVTNPQNVFEVTNAATDLPGDYKAAALFLIGNKLYVGRDAVPNGGEDLYALDVSNPLASVAGTGLAVLGKTDIDTDSYSRHVQDIKVAGQYLFLATNNSTNIHGQIQIRNADLVTNFALIGTISIPLIGGGLDFGGKYLYTIQNTSPQLQIFYNQ